MTSDEELKNKIKEIWTKFKEWDATPTRYKTIKTLIRHEHGEGHKREGA
jgi:hypothetical protein